MKQPNVLLITSDQQRWDAVGWAGLGVKTPHLEALAQRGIIYDRAYTINPVCTPTRCTLLTGHAPSKHGAYTIGTSLPADYPTVPMEFNRHGYFTSLVGKGHFSSCCTKGMFEAQPNRDDLEFFRNWRGPFYGFQDVQLAIDHGTEYGASSMHYGAWLEDQGVERRRYFGNHGYKDFGVWDLPEELHYTKWTTDRSLEAIDRAAAEARPFFLWSSYQDPHNPCFVPEPWASLHDEVPVPAPIDCPEEFATKPPFYQSVIDRNLFDAEPMLRVEKPWACSGNDRLPRDQYERLVRYYWGMVSLLDHHVGRLIDGLRSRGLLDNTIIIFTSDHGEYLGNHGHWWKWLAAYEDIHRVPMLVVDPGCKTRGERSQAIQSLLDLPRTLMSRCGLPAVPGIQGVDQTAAWQDATVSQRQGARVEFRPTEGAFAQETFVTSEWKLVCYTNPAYGELYHLGSDPHQLKNLWDSPEHLDIKARLLVELNVTRWNDEGVLRERTMWA